MFKVYQPFFKYLLPYRGKLALALVCGLIAGASSGLGLPFIFNDVLHQAFESTDDSASQAPASITWYSATPTQGPASLPNFSKEQHAFDVATHNKDKWLALPGVYSVSILPQLAPAPKESMLTKLLHLADSKASAQPPTGDYMIQVTFADASSKNNSGLPVSIDNVPVDEHVRFGLMGVILLALCVPLLFLVRAAFGYISQLLSTRVAIEVARGLQQDVFNHLQAMPMAFFDKHQRGDLQTVLNRDSIIVQSAILDTAPDLLRQPFQVISALIFIIIISYAKREIGFIIALLIVAPVCMVPVRVLGRKVRKRSREWAEQAATIAQHLWENFNGIHEIRSFNLEEPQKRGFNEKLDTFLTTQFKIKKYLLLQQPTMETVVSLLVSGIFVYAWARGISFATFTSFGMALYFAFDPIKRIGQAFNTLQQAEGNALRLQEFFANEPDIADPANPQPLNQVRGEIVFDHVTFSYGDTPALSDVSVLIPAGSNCALVGPSGAGKSTFAKLIPRFYEVSSGRLTLDGIDVRDVAQADLRRNVAIVSQFPVLFDASILENIRLGRPEATDAEAMEAARRAHAEAFIRSFPEGYQTIAGDRGDRLSGGQKQRIAIARAFLKNAPVLLLDEATSALDSESEEAIRAALADLSRGRTVITIAHRLSTVRTADLILIFEQGRLIGQGRHAELVRANSLYKTLCEKQGLFVA